MWRDLRNDSSERNFAGNQEIFVTAVTVSFSVTVVLVQEHLNTFGQSAVDGGH